MGYSKWKGCVPDVMFQTLHFKGEKKITSIHSYLKRSMHESLFGTLTNLLDSVQKHFSVTTLIRQKLVKWFAMQNSWLVSKLTTFLVKGISILTNLQPIFHLNKPDSLLSLTKSVKKHLWKSDILSKDAMHLYLKWHSTKGIFSTFCKWKPTNYLNSLYMEDRYIGWGLKKVRF